MNRGTMSRRGRAPANRSNGFRVAMGSLKSSIHGHENKLRAAQPPPVNRTPFNTIVLAFDIPGNGGSVEVDLATLILKLKDQLNLTGSDNLRCKVQRVDFWCIADEVPISGQDIGKIAINPSVSAQFFSLNPNVGNTSASGGAAKYPVLLKDLSDEGMSGVSAAVVSYSYPRAMADMSLKAPPVGLSITDSQVITTCSAPEGTTVKARFHLHWNTVDPSQQATAVNLRDLLKK